MASVTKTHNELNQTIRHDYICGRWLHDFSKHTATIIKMNTGYMVTVYLRNRLLEQLTVLPIGEKMEINDCAGATPAHLYHDPEKQTLFIGRYGRFSRDHECAVLQSECADNAAVQGELPLGGPATKVKTKKS